MKSLFEFNSYRKALAQEFLKAKEDGTFPTYHQAAKSCGIDATFFSNVLKERHHFSSDHLFSVYRALKLSEGAADYISALAEYERSSNAPRKEALKARIEELRRKVSDPKHALKNTEVVQDSRELENLQSYYLSPWTQIIHVALSLDRFARSLPSLARELRIGKPVLDQAVTALTRMGLVSRNAEGETRSTNRRLHIDRTHPLRTPHKKLMMQHALAYGDFENPESYAFSATFTMRPEKAAALKAKVLAVISEAQASVSEDDDPDAKVFQLNVDLFSWTR